MLKLFLAAAVALMPLATPTPNTRHPIAHPGHGPLIVGHRGASFDAPENTMASFNLAWDQHADAIESDFWLTADGKIACSHDEHFKRTAAVDRKVGQMTLDEVSKLDVGTWKNARFAGEHPPVLKDILATVGQGKLFFLEIKDGPKIVPVLFEEIAAAKFPLDRLRVISFKDDVIRAVKELHPEVKAYWLTSFKKDDASGEMKPTAGEILTTLKACKADGLDCKGDLAVVNEAFVEPLKAAGMELHTWTIDDPKVASRLVELGFASITTNKPGFMRKALDE